MGKEIERKFLIKKDMWHPEDKGNLYRQGYLSTTIERVVRVRTANDKGFLTVKALDAGFARHEYEYEIPLEDANQMLDTLCERPIIEKIRHVETHENMIWEIDVFLGENEGLVVAEVELESETQEIRLPDWVKEEVSVDSRYYNANLVKKPYKKWCMD